MENIIISMSQMNPSIILTYLESDKYDLKPKYQREGNVWNARKRKLLIDSIINQFDLPKIYVHELETPAKKEGKLKYFAIIDGKQRLETIWQFIENKWPLDDNFKFYNDDSIKLSGLYYKDLADKFPIIHAKFNGFPLTVIKVKANDTELIDDMFSRLNESVPLNAAELRNAKLGPIPPIIRKLIKKQFFKNRLPINGKRYRHHDLMCKFLYLKYKDGPSGTAKSYLDDFVDKYRLSPNEKPSPVELSKRTMAVLKKMENVFGTKDPLLANLGDVVVFYLLFKAAIKTGIVNKLKRDKFEDFDKKVEKNRILAQDDKKNADDDLLEFIKLHQSPNSVSAMEFKINILRKHLNL